MTPTALFVSPHLDDVAFSCGGLAALLADAGWYTVMATVFTRSVVPAQGFALACQLDKGLDAAADYMALRRDEDRDAARLLGLAECRHLDLPEAPHRGYDSAPALFAGLLPGDGVGGEVAARLRALQAELQPALVLAPQGLGNHADHLQVRAAVLDVVRAPVWWYRDTPYAIRHGEAGAPDALAGLAAFAVPVGRAMARKLDAACAYCTQVGFQFGGADGTRAALRDFARAEAAGSPDGVAAERFLGAGVPQDHAALRAIAALAP